MLIRKVSLMHRKVFALLGLVAMLFGFAVRANADSYYIYRPVPVAYFDRDDRFAGAYDVQGVVTSSVPYHLTLQVRDRAFPVVLHDGTVIKPTGTTLAPSMLVNIAGWWDGSGVFHANRIVVLRY